MDEDIWPAKMDWKTLTNYINKIKLRGYKEIIENPRITSESITNLFNNGLEIELRKMQGENKGLFISIPPGKMIIDSDITRYERDLVYFHEIVHAHYPRILDDGNLKFSQEINRQNNAITEYIARRSRANPILLRHLINAVGIEPHIYDGASFLAHTPKDFLDRQFVFKFAKEMYSDLFESSMMDGL